MMSPLSSYSKVYQPPSVRFSAAREPSIADLWNQLREKVQNKQHGGIEILVTLPDQREVYLLCFVSQDMTIVPPVPDGVPHDTMMMVALTEDAPVGEWMFHLAESTNLGDFGNYNNRALLEAALKQKARVRQCDVENFPSPINMFRRLPKWPR